ncbi:lactonase family protein [Ammoniphilus sp. YIM 78166]|uniref:lactonase family protein n=1 Tax=Ammoniphilus sp. YIM 78166 TaxID=1644106 RepID=UPI0010702EA7|nr:lactonase family protein [Ammoniphilus sp. YIM 78166]
MTTEYFAYVGCRTTKERNARGEGISVYRVDSATGEWTFVQLVGDVVNPSFLAFDRNQEFLYTVHGDRSEVSAFRIDKQTGQLTFINQQSTEGKNPVHLVVDPTNRYLVVANYISGTLAVLPINSDGSLAPLTDLVKSPGSPDTEGVDLYLKQGVSHPHHCPLDPTGRFIVVPDLGVNKLFAYQLDTSHGKLIINDPAFGTAPEGSGPRHIDFHPNQPYAYVASELDSTVVAYRFDAQTGEFKLLQTLSTLPESIKGNTCGEVAVAPSGKFVYISNRGHNSVAIFTIDQSTGLLSPVGWEPTQGETPRFFTFDPTGEFFYVANEDSDSIVQFRADETSGALVPTGQVVHTGSPVCVVFSRE